MNSELQQATHVPRPTQVWTLIYCVLFFIASIPNTTLQHILEGGSAPFSAPHVIVEAEEDTPADDEMICQASVTDLRRFDRKSANTGALLFSLWVLGNGQNFDYLRYPASRCIGTHSRRNGVGAPLRC